MKASNFLIIPLVSVLPALVGAKCYTGGEKWDRRQAIGEVDRACKELAGNYLGGRAKVSNIDVAGPKCYHFVLRRKLGGGPVGPLAWLSVRTACWLK